jgi:hypothetical protein
VTVLGIATEEEEELVTKTKKDVSELYEIALFVDIDTTGIGNGVAPMVGVSESLSGIYHDTS